MKDYRNDLEKKMHDMVRDLLDVYAVGQRKPTTVTYLRVMGQLRDVKVQLDNKEFGCATGRHAEDCSSKSHGESKDHYGTIYYYKKELKARKVT